MISPAPWRLTGQGYIFLCRFPQSFVSRHVHLPHVLSDKFIGGYGFIMFADYESSNVGRYQELLCIPGKVTYGNKRYYTISSIYVSTWDSVESGRVNWGIPKEPAEFEFAPLDDAREQLNVWKDGRIIVSCVVKRGKVPFPLSTRMLKLRLLQYYQDRYCFTKVGGFGWGRRAYVESFNADGRYFPPVEKEHIAAAAAASPFSMIFHEPYVTYDMKD